VTRAHKCEAPDCDREARGRFCDAHWKRFQRRLAGRDAPALEEPIRRRAPGARDRLREAALAYSNADPADDLDHRVQDDRLVKAAEALARERGWKPSR
jgi:hypothetical protein